jgi:hypothetical protein
MRIGHKDVAIILLGAFSRWINRLEDDDVQKPQIQTLLKALRVLAVFHAYNFPYFLIQASV